MSNLPFDPVQYESEPGPFWIEISFTDGTKSRLLADRWVGDGEDWLHIELRDEVVFDSLYADRCYTEMRRVL